MDSCILQIFIYSASFQVWCKLMCAAQVFKYGASLCVQRKFSNMVHVHICSYTAQVFKCGASFYMQRMVLCVMCFYVRCRFL